MYNQYLNNRFNKKLTEQNDVNRLLKIHPKITRRIPIYNNQIYSNLTNFTPPNNTIYHFDKNISTTINFDIPKEDNSKDKIPKILFKELPIPSYSQSNKFVLNTINKNISALIHMDIFTSDAIVEANISSIKKKNIRKIFHVYQEKYADNLYPTGFGDFIRSCFFIIQFCNKYSFKYEIIINHPIAQFLLKFSSNYSPNSNSSLILNNNVYMFPDSNWCESIFDNQNYIKGFMLIKQRFNLFVEHLCNLPLLNGCVFSYNILFPCDDTSIEECNIVRSLLEPSREICEKVDNHLSNLSLIPNQFIVLHIRSGDSYLKNENKIFDSHYFEFIKNEIYKIISTNQYGNSILLIADNNEIKILLNDFFPNIKFLVYNVTHVGEKVQLEYEKVKNTMIDFFLMSKSSFIYSLTSYPHGSGFSYWCAKIFGIPYKCKYIR